MYTNHTASRTCNGYKEEWIWIVQSEGIHYVRLCARCLCLCLRMCMYDYLAAAIASVWKVMDTYWSRRQLKPQLRHNTRLTKVSVCACMCVPGIYVPCNCKCGACTCNWNLPFARAAFIKTLRCSYSAAITRGWPVHIIWSKKGLNK